MANHIWVVRPQASCPFHTKIFTSVSECDKIGSEFRKAICLWMTCFLRSEKISVEKSISGSLRVFSKTFPRLFFILYCTMLCLIAYIDAQEQYALLCLCMQFNQLIHFLCINWFPQVVIWGKRIIVTFVCLNRSLSCRGDPCGVSAARVRGCQG